LALPNEILTISEATLVPTTIEVVSLKNKERKKYIKYTLHLCHKLENLMMNKGAGMLTTGNLITSIIVK
jgi:hypothetical protein